MKFLGICTFKRLVIVKVKKLPIRLTFRVFSSNILLKNEKNLEIN